MHIFLNYTTFLLLFPKFPEMLTFFFLLFLGWHEQRKQQLLSGYFCFFWAYLKLKSLSENNDETGVHLPDKLGLRLRVRSLAGAMLDRLYGACIHAYTAFSAIIHTGRMRFTFYEIKNSGRALLNTCSISVAFVFIYLDGYGRVFVLIFFYRHNYSSGIVNCFIPGLNVSNLNLHGG